MDHPVRGAGFSDVRFCEEGYEIRYNLGFV